MKPANIGDKITDHLSVGWFNEINKKKRKTTGNSPVDNGGNPFILPCIGEEENFIEAHTAVKITGSWLDFEQWDEGDQRLATTGVKVSSDVADEDIWGVVRGSCNQETSSKIILRGAVWAKFLYENQDHEYVKIVDNQLVSANNGTCSIIQPPQEGPGEEGLGLVLLERGGGTGGLFWFELIEDAFGQYGPAFARKTNRTGTLDGEIIQVKWWDSILNNAPAGYQSLYSITDGENIALPGACPIRCYSNGEFLRGAIPDAVVGQPYSQDLLPDGLGDIQGNRLPPGMSVSFGGVLSGTPTEAGTFHPTFYAGSPKQGPGTVNPGDECIVTKAYELVVSEE